MQVASLAYYGKHMKQYVLPILAVCVLATACTEDQPATPANPTSQSSQAETNLVRLGAVEPTADTAVNGVVQILFSQSISTVKAEINVVPEDGMYYQLWLAEADRSNPVQVGSLRSRTNDARHHTNFESKDDLRSYELVLISKQAIGSAATLEQVVASGQLNEM